MAIHFSESSGINKSFYGASQEPIKMVIQNEIEAFEQKSALPYLFKKIESENYAEKFTSKTSLGSFQNVGEGGQYPVSQMQEGFSKVAEPYVFKNSFVITHEMVADNKVLDRNMEITDFTQSYNRTKEVLGAALFAGGVAKTTTFGGSVYDCTSADGKPVFDKAHPSITGGKTQSNQFSDAFSDDALAAMESAMVRTALCC